MNPLVVTLAIDADAQSRFDSERTRLFPPNRTRIGAHVTLFHAVPGSLEQQVRDDLAEQAGPAFPVAVTRVQSLGRGAAYALESDVLAARHRALQRRWWPHLTGQDQQGFRAHVTVQNKATADVARRTVVQLQAGFVPFEITALGFWLWRYDGGPWTPLAEIDFPESA